MRCLLIVPVLALALAVAIAVKPAAQVYGMPDCGGRTQAGGCCLVCCVRPWVIPDRWTELSVPPNDRYDPGVDVYDSVGFCTLDAIGTLISFAPATGSSQAVQMGRYQAIRFGPVNKGGPDCSGAACYLESITGCEPYEVWVGDTFQVETGNMVGPTTRGIDSLISMDPTAYYDSVTKTVGGGWARSPRLVEIATYDPTNGLVDKHHVVINKFMVVFIEGIDDHGNFRGRPIFVQGPCRIPMPPMSSTQQMVWRALPQALGDITGDGRTDLSDLSALIKFLSGARSSASAPAMDVTGDGTVDLKDLAVLIEEVTGKNK